MVRSVNLGGGLGVGNILPRALTWLDRPPSAVSAADSITTSVVHLQFCWLIVVVNAAIIWSLIVAASFSCTVVYKHTSSPSKKCRFVGPHSRSQPARSLLAAQQAALWNTCPKHGGILWYLVKSWKARAIGVERWIEVSGFKKKSPFPFARASSVKSTSKIKPLRRAPPTTVASVPAG